MSFAGERASALVVEVATGRDIDHTVFALPAEPLCAFEVQVLLEDDSPPFVASAG
jgi:hypothetical protein